MWRHFQVKKDYISTSSKTFPFIWAMIQMLSKVISMHKCNTLIPFVLENTIPANVRGIRVLKMLVNNIRQKILNLGQIPYHCYSTTMLLIKALKTMYIIVFTRVLIVATIIYIVFTKIGSVLNCLKCRGNIIIHIVETTTATPTIDVVFVLLLCLGDSVG